MAEPLWQLEHIDMPGRLTDISLSLLPGITAVIGISGAGKTSLLNLLVEFEKPNAGKLIFASPTHDKEQLPVYWVPQDDGLWPHMTVMQHLTALSDKQSAAHWLDVMDLKDHAAKKPDALSRGQQNRLSVARAMVSNAAILIMDEPLAHVAHQDAMRYWQSIIDTVTRQNQSLIFATHDPSRILAYADRVICMGDGQVRQQGNTQQVYTQPQTREIAQLLGPVNWMNESEMQTYLPEHDHTRTCIRPEQLQLITDQQSNLTLKRTQFHGHVQCSSIADSNDNRKDFWHLPAAGLKTLDRVRLNLITILLMVSLLLITGCKPSGSGSKIPVKNTSVWSVPLDDISVPAPRSAKMLPDGRMVVLDTAGRVLLYDNAGKVTDTWHLPTNVNGNPEGTCLLQDNTIGVADTHYHRIVFFDMTGKITKMFGQRGEAPGQFIYPVSLTQDKDGFVYVVEYGGNDRVQKFTADMQHVMTFGKAGTGVGEFQRASGCLLHDGKLYVADAINNRLLVFDTQTGKHIDTLGAEHLDLPYDLAIDDREHFYIAEYGAGRVTEMDLSGKIIATFGSTGRGANQFMTPWSLTVTSDHKLRIMDTGNRRIVELEL
jgi:ABC-type Fe3+/spermidine/putrescine transport system ATPase subunit/DNA-binding beta-propeller fold protein YncE